LLFSHQSFSACKDGWYREKGLLRKYPEHQNPASYAGYQDSNAETRENRGGWGERRHFFTATGPFPRSRASSVSFFFIRLPQYFTEYIMILFTVSGAVLIILQYFFFIFYSIYYFIYSIYWSRRVTVSRK